MKRNGAAHLTNGLVHSRISTVANFVLGDHALSPRSSWPPIAVFTLVGIAGEDDLDAPDLNSKSCGPSSLGGKINSSEMQAQLPHRIGDLTAPSRSACRQRIDPRIEHPCAHPSVIAHIACDDGQAMMDPVAAMIRSGCEKV